LASNDVYLIEIIEYCAIMVVNSAHAIGYFSKIWGYFSKSSKTIDGLRVAIHLSIYFRQSRSAGPGSPNPRIFF
jgi:hypothetical protein